MTALKSTQDLPRAYRRLRQKLSRIGWIALGSLVERDKPGQGGPRYQWSRRIGPKTVTVALSAEQFSWLKRAVSNQREVWDVLMQLQQLTAQHALEDLPGPPRRKRLSKKRLGLN
jgi:phosphodiesterase/alkaline phosphatase D-like protein